MQSEQQQRIMGYFIEEAKDHLNTIEQGLLNLQSTIGDPEMVSEVFRAAHSVKGGAAMLGLNSIQQTSHRLEDYFKVLKECPIKVDQKLESLFLRAFDTLQELLEQLQGPFGLTDDKADEVMAEVEPVFNSLNEHLTLLVNQCGGTPPDDVQLTPVVRVPVAAAAVSSMQQAAPQEQSALQLIFKSDVPVRLREMLQLFKQADDAISRQQLQAICRSLTQAGEQFDLPSWCELLSIAERAIANTDNTYRTLAPIVIKDIKQAQENVLLGQIAAIACSEQLQALAPVVVEEEIIDDDFVNLLAEIDFEDDNSVSEFIEFELQTEAQPLAEITDPVFSDDDLGQELPDDTDWFTSATVIQEDDSSSASDIDFGFVEATPASNSATFDDLGFGNELDEASPSGQTIDQNGPEVGIAELNSLADLFEGEVPDLGMTWQEEEIINDPSLSLAGASAVDESNDFSDFLFDQDNLEELDFETDDSDDDLSALLNNSERDSRLEQTSASSTSTSATSELPALSELPPSPWDIDLDASEDNLLSAFSLPDEFIETLDSVAADDEFTETLDSVAADTDSSNSDNLGSFFSELDSSEVADDSVIDFQISSLDNAMFSSGSTDLESTSPAPSNPFELDDLFGDALSEPENQFEDQDVNLILLDFEDDTTQDQGDNSGVEILEDLSTDDLIDTLLQDAGGELFDEPEFEVAFTSTDPWAALDEDESELLASVGSPPEDQDITSDLWAEPDAVADDDAIAQPEENLADLFQDPLSLSEQLEIEPETSFEFLDFDLEDELDSAAAWTSENHNEDLLLDDLNLIDPLTIEPFNVQQIEEIQPDTPDLTETPLSDSSFSIEQLTSELDEPTISASNQFEAGLSNLLSDEANFEAFNLEALSDTADLAEDEAYLAGLFEDEAPGLEESLETEPSLAFTDAFAAFEATSYLGESETAAHLESIDDLFAEELDPDSDAQPDQMTGDLAELDLDFGFDSNPDVTLTEEALDLDLGLDNAFTDPSSEDVFNETSSENNFDIEPDEVIGSDDLFNYQLEGWASASVDSDSNIDSPIVDFSIDIDAVNDINAINSIGSDAISPDLGDSFPDSLDLAEDFDSLDLVEDSNLTSSLDISDSEFSQAEATDFSDLDSLLFGEPDNSDFSSSDSSDELGDFADLDAFLGEELAAVPASSTSDLSAPDTSPELDNFGDLDALLGEEPQAESTSTVPGSDTIAAVSDNFSDLDALLADHSVHLASNTDDFSDLDALLADHFAHPTSDSDDGFSSLEALLGEEQPAVRPTATSSTAKLTDTSSEFDDLEKLLEDADQTLGGPPTNRGSRGPSLAATRGKTRPTRGVLNDQTMRVSVKNLDNLNNLVGELVVNRNTLEQAEERLRQFLDNLLYQVQQLSDVGQRMRDLYERSLLESSLLSGRKTYQHSSQGNGGFTGAQNSHATGVSFDALEMDRFTGFHTLSQEMIELIVRVRESASDIDFVVDETDQVTRNFRQITTQLQEGLTRSRMVPFAQTADRLPRAVRDISLKCGKQAELTVEGRETLIDKMILEQLYDPMTHLVNNAITHGIEIPEERAAANKPPTGRIVVRTFHQGNQTVISVTDDGAGINPDVVKRKAIEKGLITASEAEQMSRLDVYDLLFHHGFSTKDKADDFAGRGVGMDVVRTSLNEIRGVINIDSMVGKGTTFTIRLPLTLSISKALCCISNRARIAFPMDGVEDMLDVPKERVQRDSQDRPCIQWRDQLLPFQPLSELLRYNRSLGRGSVYGGNQEDDIISVVVLRSNAGNFLALQVDQVLGEQEIVIKQLEGPVPKPVGVAGATVLGDGRIMPIADVLELIDLSLGRIRREAGSSLWEKDEDQLPPEPPETKTEPTVLIVDDSITVRELLSMTFSKIGYRVEQARDGQEAWEKLRSGLPCDLVFCDIEMPRMDGLELLSRIQKDPGLNHLPIAMLTSRGADRHRQMAIQLGAKGYFTKPYLEEALLDAAQRMLKGEVLVSSGG